jgi:5-methylcytosine-specific restriction protein A
VPNIARTPCAVPGCPELVRGGRCERHRSQHNRDTHGPDHARTYNRTWERLRNRVRAEEPLCGECLAAGIADQATEQVDHVLPIAQRPELRLVRENLQGLCRSHHQIKTCAEEGNGELSAFQRSRRTAVEEALRIETYGVYK